MGMHRWADLGMFFTVATRNLLQARRRSALLFIALGLVSCFLVLLTTLSAGMTDTLVTSATTLTAGHVNVGGFFKNKPTDMAPVLNDIGALRRIAEQNTPGLDYVIDRNRGWAKLISETRNLQTALSGIDVREEERLLTHLQMAEEREYKDGGASQIRGDPRQLAEPNTALIFVGQAKRLGVGVGDSLTVVIETMKGLSNTGTLRIVAVAKDVGFMSNWSVFVPKQTLRHLYRLNDDTSGVVMVYLKDPGTAMQAMAVLRDAYTREDYVLMEHQPQPFWMKFETVGGEDWTGQRLDLTTWEDEVGMMKWTLSALDSISFFLISVLVIIIVVGIMNAMWITVRERTREIGTLRAIGMRRRRVLAMFLVEACLLGFCASLTGGLVGMGIAIAVDAARIQVGIDAVRAILMSDVLHLSADLLQVVGSVTLFTVVTALSSLWPAARAAKLQPVTAIHRVG